MNRDIVIGALIFVGFIFIVIFAGLAGDWYLEFRPQYDSVYTSIERVGCSEDVLGQATEVNAKLRAYRMIGFGRSLPLIEIPRCE